MNRYLAALSMAAVLATHITPAAAEHPAARGAGGSFEDYARVVSVKPIVRYVDVAVPRQQCHEEQVPVHSADAYRSATPMILGGIIGGVVGNTMGKGRGKDVATVAGTILGGSIGRDVGYSSQPQQVHYETRTSCRTVNEYRQEERIDGYRVTYMYQGQRYVTRMAHDPGQRIRVRVSVQPL